MDRRRATPLPSWAPRVSAQGRGRPQLFIIVPQAPPGLRTPRVQRTWGGLTLSEDAGGVRGCGFSLVLCVCPRAPTDGWDAAAAAAPEEADRGWAGWCLGGKQSLPRFFRFFSGDAGGALRCAGWAALGGLRSAAHHRSEGDEPQRGEGR